MQGEMDVTMLNSNHNPGRYGEGTKRFSEGFEEYYSTLPAPP